MSAPETKADVAHVESQVPAQRSVSHEQDLKAEYNGGRVEDAVAADYVDPTVHISPEENKRLLRKIYKHLVPIMCVAYITQSLDKGTLGTSAIMGWQTHVNAVGQDYALTSTLLWCGVIVGEPIVNQFVRKFPVAKVLGFSMIIWSALVIGLAFSLSIPPVFGIRFLLGLFESSFQPCLITITVQWFRTAEQTMLITIWQSQFAVAGIVSNLLAYGFYHIQGRNPLYGWQWMNLTIGIISLVSSGIVLVFLPDTPVQARWTTQQEKVLYVERVRESEQGIKQKVFKKEQAWEAFKDPMVYCLFFMIFIQSLVVGGLNTFNSILINTAFGFDVLTALLVSIPLSVCQVLLYFLAAWLGTRFKQTVFTMIGFTIVNIAGTVVLITVAPSNSTRGGLLVAFYLMQCFQSTNPSMHSLLSRNIAGQTKKSIVYAVFFVGWAGGNAIGPQIFQSVWKTRYLNSLYIHLGLYVLFIADVLLIRIICMRRNAKREKALEGRENLHLRAFEDLSDLANPDFRYSY